MRLARPMFIVALLGLIATLPCEASGRVIRRLWTGAAGDTTAVGMADSTAFVGTAAYRGLYLYLKPNKPCRVAIQIRSADSTLTDSTTTVSWAWRSYTGATGALNNQADSSAWIETTLPTSVLAGEDELVYEFREDTGVGKWAGPRGKSIALAKVDTGEWYWGMNTQIRIRVLASTAGIVTWTGALHGVLW